MMGTASAVRPPIGFRRPLPDGFTPRGHMLWRGWLRHADGPLRLMDEGHPASVRGVAVRQHLWELSPQRLLEPMSFVSRLTDQQDRPQASFQGAVYLAVGRLVCLAGVPAHFPMAYHQPLAATSPISAPEIPPV